ncbi:MAG: cytochrome c biogenesis protein CcsA [Deltaproteobacteria bacterium]|jgi:ABC-type transport system involved in cytochrome c biogenesis permease subunit|nr:cytochrome c biogenesis protein CcsA [Deltaproteobacteria bacterium]
MTWDTFIWFALFSAVCWLCAGGLVFNSKRAVPVNILMLSGLLAMGIFIAGFWLNLGRPPLRTMGETRLWYGFFLAAAGYVTYRRWSYPWILLCSNLLACIFIGINLARPEIHSTSLMPALQSAYFVPHVTVYILSYAILGVATLAALIQLNRNRKSRNSDSLYDIMDNCVYIGFGFLLLGMITGALWAKEAWGHYWSWDPKETWAFITAAAYVLYIHLRMRYRDSSLTLWILPVAFVLLIIAWIGVSYLPSAQGSTHIYS